MTVSLNGVLHGVRDVLSAGRGEAVVVERFGMTDVSAAELDVCYRVSLFDTNGHRQIGPGD